MNFTVFCLSAKVHDVGCTSEEMHKIFLTEFYFFHHFAKYLSIEIFLPYGTSVGGLLHSTVP